MLCFFSSRRRHTRWPRDWSSDVCSSDLYTYQIPSERELMDEYYVSRSTVRKSIARLVDEGILEIRRGRGTFVSVKPINDWLGNLSSTNETIVNMGMEPGAKLIKAKIVKIRDRKSVV